MADLFAMAVANSAAIEKDFENLAAGGSVLDASALRSFARWVEANALISINVQLFVLAELLNGRNLQNIHEWADEQGRISGRRAEEALREKLGDFYDRRLAFDDAFIGGRAFRYGAMNARNVGLPKYAPYCMVLTRTFINGIPGIAYWPGDSLKAYFTADGSLDLDSLSRRISAHTHRHLMVAMERAVDASVAEDADWPKLVVGDNYFEAAFVGAVSLGDVQCVRMLTAERDRLWDLAFSNFGKKLRDAERALVNDFVQLQRAIKEGRIQLECFE